MITEAVAGTERRRVAWFQRLEVQVASVVLLGMAILSVVYAFVPTLASPKLLEVEPSPAFECKARAGDVVVAEFAVKNVSSGPVKLLGAQSGCSCTVSEGLPLSLDPGQVGKIRLRVNVRPFDADHVVTTSAQLFTNRDGTVPPLVVKVSQSSP